MEHFRFILRKRFPRIARFVGKDCDMLAVGSPQRQESFATILCGHNTRLIKRGRSSWPSPEMMCFRHAKRGGVAFVAEHIADTMSRSFHSAAIQVPTMVDLARPLPPTIEELHKSLLTSTTREDLRRIRKSAFCYRVETKHSAVRDFHENYAGALLKERFPYDGQLEAIEKTLSKFEKRGELICLDSENEWLAGIINFVGENCYSLGRLGIRGGSDDIRRKYVVSALIVRSLERGVELGSNCAGLGRSIPFLGKGPIWFKAKWGGLLSLSNDLKRPMMLLDVRHQSVRKVLSRNPILLCDSNILAVACWLEAGNSNLQKLLREKRMFPSVERWYVIGEASAIDPCSDVFSTIPSIVPVTLSSVLSEPIWLGQLLNQTLHVHEGKALKES